MSPEIPGSRPSQTQGKKASSGSNVSRLISLVLQPKRRHDHPVEYKLHKERIVLGAVVSADVRLSGEGVAPLHAVIEQSGPETAIIYDLASDSGVFVNGKKVVTQTLQPGDEITLGLHVLKFELLDVAEAAAQVAAKTGASSSDVRIWESEGRKLFVNSDEDLPSLLLLSENQVEEIFDYRPSSKQALEVVMAWLGTILNVEHFVKEKQVTLGTTLKSDFGVPSVLSATPFPLVSRTASGLQLNIDQGMTGVIQTKGKLVMLKDLPSKTVPLEQDDFAKVSLGDVDFYLSFTAAPPRLKRTRLWEKDPLFTKIFFSSMLLTALIIGSLIEMRPSQNLEAEQLPDRIATILYQPEKYQKPTVIEKAKAENARITEPKEEKKPEPPKEKTVAKLDIKPNPSNVHKPVPKEMNVAPTPAKNSAKLPAQSKHAASSHTQSEAKEGEGARAKGKEGSRGSKNAASSSNQQSQTQAQRPSPEAGKGRGGGNSQVQDQGNIDFLKGASGKIEDLLGNAGQKLGKAGDKLKGFGGFTTQGNGGLALSGSGAGGGGTADTLGGLSTKGTGGGRVGTGKGATGNGDGIIGGKTRVAIRTGGPEEAVVMGAIDADAVEAALLAHKDEFRLCYEREINAEHPTLAGRVGTSFVIGSTGRVDQAGIESSTLGNANVERCIINVIKRIDFPIPHGAGMVQVTYPFKFNSIGH